MNETINNSKPDNQTQETFRIWYPGAFYADKLWIEYLKNKFIGEWCFSDTQASKPEWAEFMPDAQYITELNTLSIEALRFQKQFKPNIIILSMHPGLHQLSEIQILLDNFTELPETIVYRNLNRGDNYLKGYIQKDELILPDLIVIEFRKS